MFCHSNVLLPYLKGIMRRPAHFSAGSLRILKILCIEPRYSIMKNLFSSFLLLPVFLLGQSDEDPAVKALIQLLLIYALGTAAWSARLSWRLIFRLPHRDFTKPLPSEKLKFIALLECLKKIRSNPTHPTWRSVCHCKHASAFQG